MESSSPIYVDVAQPSANVLSLPARRPRILLDRWRATLIVTLACGSLAWGGKLFFGYVEAVSGNFDGRDEQVSAMFAAIMGCCWLVSVFLILRRR